LLVPIQDGLPVIPDHVVVPAGPVAPVLPFKFLNANENVLAFEVPPNVTVTEGVPTFASTVALALVIVAAAPAAPVSPFSPFSPVSPFGPAIVGIFKVTAEEPS